MRKNLRYVIGAAALFVCVSVTALPQPGSKVRIGYCGALKDIDAAKAAGFDYMEVRTSEVAALPDADFEQLASKLKRIGLAVPAAYWFVPAEIKLTGPEVDKARQMEYVRRALDRASRLGVKVIVFGSGGARQYPEGFSKQEAFAQLVDFGKRVGPEAKSRDITIAIEPQRIEECNIINTTAEALQWVTAVNHPNIQLMIDYYHFSVNKEDPAIIPKVQSHLKHLHMANPVNRVMPLKMEEYNYAPFFAMLRQIGYDKMIGLEASSKDLQVEGPQTIALLRGAFAR